MCIPYLILLVLISIVIVIVIAIVIVIVIVIAIVIVIVIVIAIVIVIVIFIAKIRDPRYCSILAVDIRLEGHLQCPRSHQHSYQHRVCGDAGSSLREHELLRR
jgi:hypothetical protein